MTGTVDNVVTQAVERRAARFLAECTRPPLHALHLVELHQAVTDALLLAAAAKGRAQTRSASPQSKAAARRPKGPVGSGNAPAKRRK